MIPLTRPGEFFDRKRFPGPLHFELEVAPTGVQNEYQSVFAAPDAMLNTNAATHGWAAVVPPAVI
jgi:hypothetical protein